MTTVIYLENGLNPQLRVIKEVEPASIRSLAPTWQIPFVAFVDGKPILRADWDTVVEDGHSLAFIEVGAIPQGGGGGSSNPLRTILMIGLMYMSGGLASTLYGAMGGTFVAANAAAVIGAVQMGVVMAGSALINAVIPPPKPPSPQQAASLASASPTYSLQAQGNSARIDAAIPEHFGQMLAYPDFAAQPYAEFQGNEQYLYELMCVGRGSYAISNLRIEDSPISSFDDVQYEIVEPNGKVTLFPASVSTSPEVSGQTLTNTEFIGPFVINAAGTVINQVSFDLAAPRGLYWANDDGSLSAVTTYPVLQLLEIDDLGNPKPGAVWTDIGSGTQYTAWSSWTNVTAVAYYDNVWVDPYTAQVAASTPTVEFASRRYYTGGGRNGSPSTTYTLVKRTRSSFIAKAFSGATTTPQRVSWTYSVPAGRYMARAQRSDAENTASRCAHNVAWAGLRGYHPEAADKTYGDVTLIAVKMRASNNLSMQSSRKLNLVAMRKLPVWNGSTWSAPVETRSPSWALAYAAKQIGLTDQQIDLAGLLVLDATCTARGDTFDARFDNFLTFWEAATKIAGAVRAKPFMQGGVLRVIRDQAVTIPVAMFSQRNIVRGSLSVNYLMPTPETADAVDVKYFDETNWSPMTVRAKLADSSASVPAKIDLFGVTKRLQAYREGLYQSAANRYRRRIIKFQTEMEGFIPSFGDLIAIQHDMPAWGQSGEILGWNSTTRVLTLSETPVWGTGIHYIGLRKRDGSIDGPYAVGPGASPNLVILAQAPAITPYTGTSEEKTHYAFGASETWRQPARVLSAKPLSLNTVEIEAINEDPSVHSADFGVTAPAIVTSGLANYTNAPRIGAISAKMVPFGSGKMVVSWAPVIWAQYYILEQSGDGISWTGMGSTESPGYTATALSGLATKIRVAAVGLSRGVWSQCDITPTPVPSDVVSITATTDAAGVTLNWEASTDPYFLEYEVRVGGANWSSAAFVGRARVTQLVLPLMAAGTYIWRVKKIDDTAQVSANDATITKVIAAPSTPTVAHSISGQNEVLSWGNCTASFSVDRYEVRQGASWAAGTPIDSVKATSLTRKVDWSGSRTYWVAGIDSFGNVGVAGSVTKTMIALGTPQSAMVSIVNDSVSLSWAAPSTGSLPVVSYEVRHGATWGAAIPIATVTALNTVTVANWTGARTFLIAAIDSSGTVGAAASVVGTISVPTSPSSLSFVQDGANLTLSWAAATGTLSVVSYEVRYGAVGVAWASATSLSIGNALTCRIPINWVGSRDFLISAKDSAGNVGAPSAASTSTVVVPGTVQSFAAAFSSSGTVALTWAKPLTGTLPIAHYEIRHGASWGTGVAVATVNALTYSVPISWAGSRTFMIQAVDVNGNVSTTTVSAVSTVIAPNAPGSLNSTQDGQNLVLSWTASSGTLPVASYEVRYGSTGVTWATGTPVSTQNALSCRIPISWVGDRVFLVAAVDSNGTVGAASTGHTKTITGPGAPQAPSVAYSNNGMMTLSWTPPVSGSLAIKGYEVRYGTLWASATSVATLTALTTQIPMNWNGSRQFLISAIDVNDNVSTAQATIAGVTQPPAAITGLTSEVVSTKLVLTWTSPTISDGKLPIKTYEVRRGASWAAGTTVVVTADTKIQLEIDWTSSATFWVAATDINAVTGATTAFVTSNISAPGAVTPSAGVSSTDLVISWAAAASNGLPIAKYEVRQGASWVSDSYVGTSTGTTITVPVTWVGARTFWVAASDTAGNTATAASVTYTVAAHGAVAALAATTIQATSSVNLTWTASSGTLPIASYEIRYGAVFASAQVLGRANSTSFSVPVSWTGARVFWVVPIDSNGNFGTESSATSTIATLSAPALSATLVSIKSELSWSVPVGSLPVFQYEIRTGASWATGTFFANSGATKYRVPVDWVGARTFWVAAIDTAGVVGAASSVTVSINVPNAPVIDGTASVVGGAMLDQYRLAWAESVVDGTRLPISTYKVGFGSTTLANINGTTYIASADWGGAKTFWVQAIDVNGNASAQSLVPLTVSPPSAPSTLTAQVVDNNVLLYWGDAPATLPVTAFEISKEATFSTNSALYIGKKSGGFTTVFETTAGTYTYYVRAVDSAGNVGAYKSVAATVAQPPDYVLNALWNSTFSGTKSNAVIDADGSLLLPVNTSETWTTHYTGNSFATPQSQIDAGYPYYAMPTPASGYYEEIFNYGTSLPATKVTVTTNADIISSPSVTCDISTSPNGTAWTTFTGVWSVYATNFQYVKVRITVNATGGNDQIDISNLTVTLDSKIKNDGGSKACLSTDVGGTVVNFNIPFVDISSITVTPLGTTPVTAIYDFVDAPNPTSFKILLFNSAGTRVSGTASWSVKGY